MKLFLGVFLVIMLTASCAQADDAFSGNEPAVSVPQPSPSQPETVPEGSQLNNGYVYDELTYELVWNDEFDYEGPPDRNKWGYDTGGHGWGNNELQYYTDGSNAYADGSKLIIEAREEQMGGRDYTSARLITKNKGDWLYGKIEVSARLPSGLGTWPAIWMLPTDWAYGGWPASGEIDIMEHVGYDQDIVHATVHTAAFNHTSGTQKGNGGIKVDNASEIFNTYAVEWLPDRIIFFINDEQVYEFDAYEHASDVTYRHWPFDKRFHLLINIALGGNWGGAQGFDPDMLPVFMEIDYVRVYQSPQINKLAAEQPGIYKQRELADDTDLMTVKEVKIKDAVLKAIYTTTDDKNMWVSRNINDVIKQEDGSDGMVSILVDPGVRYQAIDGFGASFTDSSAYLINQVLTGQNRDELMKKLFDPYEGIGLSVIRNPMGSSDYARFMYTYNDIPASETDLNLERFSIDHDRQDIIPLTKQAMALNPDLKLIATPWSPPAWMKSSGTLIGGALMSKYYEVYGDYFIRFIDEYQKEGINVYAVTAQNEPLYVPKNYPGCDMPAEMQAAFINRSLGPKLREKYPDVKLLCYDHNWDRPDYPEYILDNAGGFVDGVAWHVYGGSPDAQTKVLKQFPDTEVHFTEASGGDWVPPFDEAFFSTIRTGIEVLNNFSRSMILWNMALDENNGPVIPGFGLSTCRGIVQINQSTGDLVYNLDYYALAHFSKYIRPGAERAGLEIINSENKVYATACINNDNSLVIVALNDDYDDRSISFEIEGSSFIYPVKGRTALTVVIDLVLEVG